MPWRSDAFLLCPSFLLFPLTPHKLEVPFTLPQEMRLQPLCRLCFCSTFKAAVQNQQWSLAINGPAEASVSVMQVFQSRLTEQVDSISDKVAQLSAAQSLSPLLANTAGVFDPMPKAVEEAVIRSAESPQEPIQIPADGKESAYERMQVSCHSPKQIFLRIAKKQLFSGCK